MMTNIADVKLTSSTELMGWYRKLAPNEKRTFWACLGGWALDALDVQIFSFAIPAIVAAFSITNADAGLIGTVTLLTSAFGGWFAGMLADRFGRVRMLQISVAWFAIFTFLCGFAQTYNQLLDVRWSFECNSPTWSVNRCVRRHCLWPAHSRGPDASRNEGAGADA
jgi:sugar phosphate permease